MCGITGVFERRGATPARNVLAAMTSSLHHRGPDGDGTYFHEGVGLGHRRLSIIGISDGAQPLSNEDQTVWVTYNGEIYNHLALRAELESAGHVFRTSTDSEVLVHGYEQWGSDLPRRLRGIFAFAVHDQKRKKLFLARDRFGVKPLYFSDQPDVFAFASEPKALLLHPKIPRRPDLDAIYLYARFGYVPAPFSAFSGLSQLEPGTQLEVTQEQTTIHRYWTLPAIGSGGADERDLDDRIDETVRAELMSEVPLGAFLSGGIDSSVVAAAMAQARVDNQHLRTFCIAFDEAQFDESGFARAVAEAIGLEHTVERVSLEQLGLLKRLVDVYDEPFADASAIPTFVLCETARAHLTVALSGDGGDEIFGGYRRYREILDYTELPSAPRRLLRKAANRYPETLRGYHRLQRTSRPLPEQYEYEMSTSDEHIRRLFTPELHRKVDWSLSKVFERAPGESFVAKAQWVDAATYLPYDILTKVDRASMANSLEVRVPLLDHEFVEWAAGLPHERTFAGGVGKLALKEHLARRIPRSLFERPKMGFGVPLERWLGGSGGIRESVTALRRRHPKGRFFSPVRESTVDDLLSSSASAASAHRLWSLMFLETWWQRHFL